ncbi:hypothetical protein MNV49_002628 [Pseudohyphozyma bogoriensis]|nr:hypothetical protein MNV49_002628 [Pseudohyphozyma bogoriensis]
MPTWINYWTCDIVNISGWQKCSAMITLGLDWRNAIGAVMIGCAWLIIPLLANGYIGSKYRIPFPIAMRSSMGYYFANFAIVSRAVIALFWFGIQSWNGQACMAIVLGAMWPSFKHIPNHLPTSAGFTTQQMLAYVMFWLVQFPILFIHPTKLKPFLIVKAVTVPICSFAIMGWCVHKANTMGGTGTLLAAGPTVHGSAFAAAWLRSMTALIGGFATLGLNIPDFTRYSKKPTDMYVVAPIFPFIYAILAVVSVVSASCTKVIVGKVLWSPTDIISLWPNRSARFFAAVPWLIAQIGTNVTTNSISAANDISTLFPRYLNIRRGQILVAIVGGWAMVPWKILASATTFYNFISGYAIVLGPFAGLMICDFYFIKKRKLDTPALYDPHGRYRLNKVGTNWKAAVAFCCGCVPNVPGLAKAVKPSIQIGKAAWIYYISWCFGILATSLVFTILELCFPDKSGSIVEEPVFAEEWLAEREAETGVVTPESDSYKEKQPEA